MRLIFARHGQSQANILEEFSNRGVKHPLTETGIGQAQLLAAGLAALGVTEIFTSPLLRAVQTAGILSEQLGLPYEVTAALCEFDVGILEGRSDAESWGRFDRLLDGWLRQDNWNDRLPGGESFEDLRARFVPFVTNLVKTCSPDANLVLVGHGGTYRCMLPLVVENIDFAFMRDHPLGNAELVIVERRQGKLFCLNRSFDVFTLT